jgi:predicted MFS family arabinose efflux permease
MHLTTEAAPSLATRPFVLLAVVDFAYFLGAGVTIHTLPLYVTGPLAGSEADAGLAFGAFALTALLLRPVAGRLCDTRGRRPLLAGGAVLAAVVTAAMVPADTLAVVVALRVLLGVAEAAFMVASFAALADLAPAGRLGEALSYNSLGLYLGLALGPPLGEVLVAQVGLTGAWTAAALLCACAAVLVGGVGETRPATQEAAPASYVHRPAVPAALGFFTSVVAMAGVLAFSTLRAVEVDLATTSAPLLVYGAVVVVCRIACARVHDRFPPLVMGACALVVIGLGLVVVALGGSAPWLLAGAAVVGLGVTFSTPAFFAAIFSTAAPSQRGAASGTASVFFDLGLGVGPVGLGLVASAGGLSWAFATAGLVAGVGAIWTAWLAARVSRPALSAGPGLRPT